jgi:hypothetical protein
MPVLDLVSSSTQPGGHMDKPLARLDHMPTALYYQPL